MSQPVYRSQEPVKLSRYLLPREIQVAWLRQHPAVLIIPGAQAFGGLTLAIIWTFALQHNYPELAAVWTAAVLVLFYGARAVLRWWGDYFMVTTERIMRVSGTMHRITEMAPLSSLTEMRLRQPLAGRMFGYGDFLNGPGKRPEAIWTFVPYPEELYLLITGMLFPSGADDEGGEPDQGSTEALTDEL